MEEKEKDNLFSLVQFSLEVVTGYTKHKMTKIMVIFQVSGFYFNKIMKVKESFERV